MAHGGTPGAAPGLLERPRKALQWQSQLPRRDLHGWPGGARAAARLTTVEMIEHRPLASCS